MRLECSFSPGGVAGETGEQLSASSYVTRHLFTSWMGLLEELPVSQCRGEMQEWEEEERGEMEGAGEREKEVPVPEASSSLAPPPHRSMG